MSDEPELIFEDVSNNRGLAISRAKVPGGWLYKEDNTSGAHEWISSITFVPEADDE